MRRLARRSQFSAVRLGLVAVLLGAAVSLALAAQTASASGGF